MRIHTFVVFGIAFAAFAPATAEAHFKLEQPADWLQTDATGDPTGGTQKTNPCGSGTASGDVTQVAAGASLHVKLTETVPHGGHYRIALIPKLDIVSDDIPEPNVTYASDGSCDSAAVESPVSLPILADNLWPHTQAEASAGKVWETDVTIPSDASGDATLQIIEFMTPHGAPCFYHHCAQLHVVAQSSGDDGGPVINPSDGGVVADASAPHSGSDAGGAHDAGGTNSGNNAGAGEGGGCSVGGSATPSLLTMGMLALTLAAMLRRRARVMRPSARRLP